MNAEGGAMDADGLAGAAGLSREGHATAPPPSGRFQGRAAFEQLVRDAFARAADEGWPEIIISDASFEDWPLRERVVVDALRAWSKTGRHFTMLAKRFDSVQRNQPRFVTWRKTWSHIIDCRHIPSADALDFPSAIWSRGWVMQRLDLAHSAGVCGNEPERRVALRELLNERLRASTAGFAATTLGL
jgi:hypothetical protein